MMIDGLRRLGVEVIICHEPLWRNIDDRVTIASGGWNSIRFLFRVISTYSKLLSRYVKVGAYDVMFLGYPAHYDVLLAWILAKIKRKPLCWDILMSIYQVAIERKLDRISPGTILLIKIIERYASRLPDMLFLESEEYIEWYTKTHDLSRKKFRKLPMGVDTDKYHPIEKVVGNSKFTILYYGSFIPNHGVQLMAEAASQFSNHSNILFNFIGTGPEYGIIKKWIDDKHINNVHLLGWVDDETLLSNISQADMCMGVFGITPQSHMTIQHKILECLAMKKPVISGESALMKRTFTHKENIYLCERNVTGLVNGLIELINDSNLRKKIALNGYDFVIGNFSFDIIGKLCLDYLHEIIN